MNPPRVDVVILGTGLGGTILGAILARHGLKVLLVEEQSHPRFAIGESTIPETTLSFRLLAARYDVPEIAYLSSHHLLRRHVGSAHGVKRNFSFVWHEPGVEQRPHESTQYPTAGPPIGPDVHLFRQDSDAWMLSVAMRYGCSVLQRTRVDGVEIEADGVRLHTQDGRTIRSEYVVDAGGLKSMLATRFGLRQTPVEMKTRSRAIYTHLLGVRPYDAIGGGPRAHELPSPLSQGTLHHIFDGGWMWVIAFNNHPSSTNPLVSVGLMLDSDRSPRTNKAPEEEFWGVVGRYPSMKRMFEGATAAREWTGTDRIQFGSTTSVGDRFCMLPHAFAFVDPLYSSGLSVTMNAINRMSSRLIAARVDGDWSGARFAPVDEGIKHNYRYYDRLVAGSYTSWRSFPLWNAWTRLWMLGGLIGSFAVNEQAARCRRAAQPHLQDDAEHYPYRGVQGSELKELAGLLNHAEPLMDAVKEGRLHPDEASAQIFGLVGESGLWPAPWGPLSPKQRHSRTFTMLRLYRNGLWLRYRAPEPLRPHYYATASGLDTLAECAKDVWTEVGRGVGAVARHLRDYAADNNEDWRGGLAGSTLRPALTDSAPKVDEKVTPAAAT